MLLKTNLLRRTEELLGSTQKHNIVPIHPPIKLFPATKKQPMHFEGNQAFSAEQWKYHLGCAIFVAIIGLYQLKYESGSLLEFCVCLYQVIYFLDCSFHIYFNYLHSEETASLFNNLLWFEKRHEETGKSLKFYFLKTFANKLIFF